MQGLIHNSQGGTGGFDIGAALLDFLDKEGGGDF